MGYLDSTIFYTIYLRIQYDINALGFQSLLNRFTEWSWVRVDLFDTNPTYNYRVRIERNLTREHELPS
jgi:hypothetical protein